MATAVTLGPSRAPRGRSAPTEWPRRGVDRDGVDRGAAGRPAARPDRALSDEDLPDEELPDEDLPDAGWREDAGPAAGRPDEGLFMVERAGRGAAAEAGRSAGAAPRPISSEAMRSARLRPMPSW